MTSRSGGSFRMRPDVDPNTLRPRSSAGSQNIAGLMASLNMSALSSSVGSGSMSNIAHSNSMGSGSGSNTFKWQGEQPSNLESPFREQGVAGSMPSSMPDSVGDVGGANSAMRTTRSFTMLLTNLKLAVKMVELGDPLSESRNGLDDAIATLGSVIRSAEKTKVNWEMVAIKMSSASSRDDRKMSTVHSEVGGSDRDSQISGAVRTDPMAATSYREREVKLASEIEREVAADTDNEAKGKSGEGDGGAPRRGVARKGSLLTEAQELMGDLAKMDTEIGNAVPNTDVSPEKRGSQSPSPTNGSSKGRASLARKESVGVVLEPIGGVGVSPASAEGVGEKEPLESIAASPIQKNSLDGLGAAKGAGGSEGANTGEAEEKCGEKSSIIEGRSPIELRRSSSGGLTMSGTNLVFAPLGSVPGSRPQPHSRPGSASSPDNMHVPEGDDDSPAAVKIDAAPSGSENTDHNPKDALTRSDASMMSAVTFQETPSEQQRKTAAGRMQDTENAAKLVLSHSAPELLKPTSDDSLQRSVATQRSSDVSTKREKSGRRKSQWGKSPYNFNVANDEDADGAASGSRKKSIRTSANNGNPNHQKMRRASSLSSVGNFLGARRKVT
mmetsp:Transcript_43165/g.116653  ORF Transcript_43165/g.116653 Transcript_43165/m.116653 type:complete len:612 (-) Transcript_43165:2509-4344(-)